MFFLITNLTVGEYYPKFFTQFIVGCVLYVIVLFMLNDMVSDDLYDEYKYYIGALIVIDLAYLIYKAKFCEVETEKEKESRKKSRASGDFNSETTELMTDTENGSIFSSDVNDYKITHDISSSETKNNEGDLFSSDNELVISLSSKQNTTTEQLSNKNPLIDSEQTKINKTKKIHDNILKDELSDPLSYQSDTINSEELLKSLSVSTISL